MSEFFRFWIDCFTIGATWGNGVFGIIEIICAILWVFYRKKHDNCEARSGREDRVRAFGKWCFIIVVIFSTIVVAPYLKYQQKEDEASKSEKVVEALSSSNSFLSGQIEGNKTTIQNLQNQVVQTREDAETDRLNSKTDLNEANREKDAALQRLTFWEANPEKLAALYNNIFTHTPTNFPQFDSMLGQFNIALSKITEIETETKQLQNNATQLAYTSNQLADLGIEKLPDGRTKIGTMISGRPNVVIEAINEGYQSYTNRDFNTALGKFQKGINALEATHISGDVMITGGDITPKGRGQLYGMAADCAIKLYKNDLAKEYAQKSVEADPQPISKLFLTYAIANLALAKAQTNDIAGSFESFQMAIDNYET
ncbi:MAG TPA: hypothetical protein VMA35_15675, partial [Candidatus Sulfopaludibacter sp.]|nr:hypothetical protein [Candidatus Sulfopaludibacter sp.]